MVLEVILRFSQFFSCKGLDGGVKCQEFLCILSQGHLCPGSPRFSFIEFCSKTDHYRKFVYVRDYLLDYFN